MCLLRVELGVLTNGRLGTVELVSEYIKHEQAEEVPNTTFYYGFWGWGGEGAEFEFQEIMLVIFFRGLKSCLDTFTIFTYGGTSQGMSSK